MAVVRFGSVILVGLALLASGCGPSAPTTNVQATVAAQVEATVAARTVASICVSDPSATDRGSI